jgi:ATP-dependent RNA helicase HelY
VTGRRERFLAALGFGVDEFQLAAFDAVDASVNVLVSAPTGSGKTLIATYAIERQLDAHQRAFYTTPLKALSNQKYHELVRLFGESRVGLLTGDTSINRDAEVVVMTTEVLRNMLLTESRQIRDLGLVVLDEVHFLQDPFRGGVWEEVIILTPSAVQFVALSATVSNAAVVGEWLTGVRGPTEVVVEQARPIALHHQVAIIRRGDDGPALIDLLDNRQLSSEAKRVDTLMNQTRKFRPGPQWRGPKGSGPPAPFSGPRRSELLEVLDRADLLPAIVFIFSRAACDDAVRQVRRDGLVFTTPEQKAQARQIATDKVAEFSSDDLRALEFDEFIDALERGIAAHHAGMVPSFREIVEACFEANLLGVVFATETLSLGINMPARTVVLERFNKYSDAGRALLTAGEFAQLTGRAGRRGLDDEGHSVVCFAPETPMRDVARVAMSPAPDLHSSFRPTYNLTANLIFHFDPVTAVEVLERSFAQFEADRRPASSRRSLTELMAARHGALEDLGYAEGWKLTEMGERLRTLYHECDLLIAETLGTGILRDAEPATVAAVLSAFVYEPRRAKNTGPHRRTPTTRRRVPNDRLGDERRRDISERLGLLRVAYARVIEAEARHRVNHVREPDPGFAVTIAAWVRGAPLDVALDVAEYTTGAITPGDFVRNAKQVADLCEQVGRLSTTELAQSAREAKKAIDRSVVAGISVIRAGADPAT